MRSALRFISGMVIGVFLIIQAMGLGYANAQAALDGAESKQNEVFNITVGEWPPYISKDLAENGAIAHIIKTIFLDMGIKVRFYHLPWARAYEEAALGHFDATAVWLRVSSREKDFIYSDPLLSEQFVFFHQKSFKFNWTSIKDLKGLTIGGNHISTYGPEIDAAIEKGLVNIDRVNGYKQNFDRLVLGRINLFPMEKNVGYFILRSNFSKEKQKQITHHSKVLFDNFSYLLFSKKSKNNPELIARFNKHLKLFRESGRYDQYMADLSAGKYDQPETNK
ncbi:MAG: transporter substrate-binding domain-containing protein [Sneathiella sp.]